MENNLANLINRVTYNLKKFGLTPSRLFARWQRKSPNVIVISIPKSGTHFLESIFLNLRRYRRMLPYPTLNDKNLSKFGGFGKIFSGKSNTVFYTHLHFNSEYLAELLKLDYKILFLYRDPRDNIMSSMNYLMNQPKHEWHGVLNINQSKDYNYRVIIDGNKELKMYSIVEKYKCFEGWYDSEHVQVLSYEKLYKAIVEQDASLLRNHLSCIDISEKELDCIMENAINRNSPTFLNPGVLKFKREEEFPTDYYHDRTNSTLKKFEFD